MHLMLKPHLFNEGKRPRRGEKLHNKLYAFWGYVSNHRPAPVAEPEWGKVPVKNWEKPITKLHRFCFQTSRRSPNEASRTRPYGLYFRTRGGKASEGCKSPSLAVRVDVVVSPLDPLA